MVIDLDRCIGCYTCAVACKSENNEPEGIWWNRIFTVGGPKRDLPEGEYPHLKRYFMPVNCQHCANPPCTKVCPTGATYQKPNGVVTIDYNICIGCRYCMVACPYGVRQFNWGEPVQIPEFGTGSDKVRPRFKGIVEKCSFCEHRLEEGLEPFCIEVCPARARHFGDLDDPESEIVNLIARSQPIRLLEELGTEPRVYYLLGSRRHGVHLPEEEHE